MEKSNKVSVEEDPIYREVVAALNKATEDSSASFTKGILNHIKRFPMGLKGVLKKLKLKREAHDVVCINILKRSGVPTREIYKNLDKIWLETVISDQTKFSWGESVLINISLKVLPGIDLCWNDYLHRANEELTKIAYQHFEKLEKTG